MPPRAEIRRADADDVDALAELNQTIHELHRSALPSSFLALDRQAVVRHYADVLTAGHVLLLAEVAGRVAGFVHAEYVLRAATPFQPGLRLVYVHELVVEAADRRRGIGSALMAAVADEGRRAGADEVRLQHYAFNDAAHRFYERLGYRTALVTMTTPLA